MKHKAKNGYFIHKKTFWKYCKLRKNSYLCTRNRERKL